MNPRSKLNLGLALSVVALVSVVILKPGQEPPSAPPTLLTLNPGQINRLQIERPEQEALSFQRQDGSWNMLTPSQAPANIPLLERLLMIADVRCPLHYQAVDLDLARLGLEPPRLRLLLNEHVLSFGDTESLNEHRYVRVDDTVYLCADLYYPLLVGPAAGFRK